jgi:hypothetical protein
MLAFKGFQAMILLKRLPGSTYYNEESLKYGMDPNGPRRTVLTLFDGVARIGPIA